MSTFGAAKSAANMPAKFPTISTTVNSTICLADLETFRTALCFTDFAAILCSVQAALCGSDRSADVTTICSTIRATIIAAFLVTNPATDATTNFAAKFTANRWANMSTDCLSVRTTFRRTIGSAFRATLYQAVCLSIDKAYRAAIHCAKHATNGSSFIAAHPSAE
jgi:hypothetical protein